eukprot:CFRG6069T1
MAKKKTQSGPKPGSGQGNKKKKKGTAGVDRGFATASVVSNASKNTVVVDDSDLTQKSIKGPSDTASTAETNEGISKDRSSSACDETFEFNPAWKVDPRVPTSVATELPLTKTYTSTDIFGKAKSVTYTLSQPATPLVLSEQQEARIESLYVQFTTHYNTRKYNNTNANTRAIAEEEHVCRNITVNARCGTEHRKGISEDVGFDFLRTLYDYLIDKLDMPVALVRKALVYAYDSETSDVKMILSHLYMTCTNEDFERAHTQPDAVEDAVVEDINFMSQNFYEVIEVKEDPHVEVCKKESQNGVETSLTGSDTNRWWAKILTCPYEEECDIEQRLDLEEDEEINSHVYGSEYVNNNNISQALQDYWKRRYPILVGTNVDLVYDRFRYFWSLEKECRLQAKQLRKARSETSKADAHILSTKIQDARFHIDAISSLSGFLKEWIDRVEKDLYNFRSVVRGVSTMQMDVDESEELDVHNHFGLSEPTHRHKHTESYTQEEPTPEILHIDIDTRSAHPPAKENEGEGYGVGMEWNIFDCDEQAPVESVEMSDAVNDSIADIPRYVDGVDVGARTPSVVLSEMIKQKFGTTEKPTYRLIVPRKPQVGGFDVTDARRANELLDDGTRMFVNAGVYAAVQFKTKGRNSVIELAMGSDGVSWHGPCVTKQEAYDYIALLALRNTFPKLDRLHLSMPKVFQDLWKLWDRQAEERELKARANESFKRDDHVKSIMHVTTSFRGAAEGRTNAVSPTSNSTSPAIKSDACAANYISGISAHSARSTLSPDTGVYDRLSRVVSRNMQSKKAAELREVTESLPVFRLKAAILEAASQNQVVVVSGATGSGKSTQVPKYLVQELLLRGIRNGSTHAHMPTSTLKTAPFVVCTEPRRLSAISIATRVSAEMGEAGVGSNSSVVGYSVRLETKRSPLTRLLFCTTGVLLRWLQSDQMASQMSHIIIDEVHERSVQTDFLLALLRPILRLRPNLKVILMSATLDAAMFKDYFRSGGCDRIAHIDVEGRTFPVDAVYLTKAVRFADYVIEDDSPYARRAVFEAATVLAMENSSKTTTTLTESLIDQMKGVPASVLANGGTRGTTACVNDPDERASATVEMMNTRTVNYDLIESIVLAILGARTEADKTGKVCSKLSIPGTDICVPQQGAILVFLPGVGEINMLLQQLEAHPEIAQGNHAVVILPLHSKLTPQDQARVFRDYNECTNVNSERFGGNTKHGTGKQHGGEMHQQYKNCNRRMTHKIILSTNIAETGVTIPDVTVVLDTCRQREMRFDEVNGTDKLEECFVSQSSALQRRGRAGRVQRGICFHLVSHKQYSSFASHPRPEMTRVALDNLCIQLLKMGLHTPQTWLLGTLTPPTHTAISRAIEKLVMVGAVAPYPSSFASSPSATTSIPIGNPHTEDIDARNSPDVDSTLTAAFDFRMNLTALGQILADLPADVGVGKMLVLGVTLQCLEPVLCIAAAVSHHKSVFLKPTDGPDAVRARVQHRKFATGPSASSDHLAIWRVWSKWSALRNSDGCGSMDVLDARGDNNDNMHATPVSNSVKATNFCSENLLDQTALKAIDSLRIDLWSNLKQSGILAYLGDRPPKLSSDPLLNRRSHSLWLVRGVILAGMYPHLAIRGSSPCKGKERMEKNTNNNRRSRTNPPEFRDGLRNSYAVPKTSVYEPLSTERGANPMKRSQFTSKSRGGIDSNVDVEWICYHSKTKANRFVYVQTVTDVNAMAVLLFAPGQVSIHHGLCRVVVGHWIHLQAQPRSASLLVHAEAVIDTVVNLLSS